MPNWGCFFTGHVWENQYRPGEWRAVYDFQQTPPRAVPIWSGGWSVDRCTVCHKSRNWLFLGPSGRDAEQARTQHALGLEVRAELLRGLEEATNPVVVST